MKTSLVSTLLILSFLGISVLGFVTMNNGSFHEDELCVTEAATGLECPNNPFAFADFHLNPSPYSLFII